MPTKLNVDDFMNNEVNMIHFYDIKSNRSLKHLQKITFFWPLRALKLFVLKYNQIDNIVWSKEFEKANGYIQYRHMYTCIVPINQMFIKAASSHNKMIFLLSWNTTLMPFGKRIMVQLNAFCKYIKQFIWIMECKTIYYWRWSAIYLR